MEKMLILILCLPLALPAQQQPADTVVKHRCSCNTPIRSVHIDKDQLIVTLMQPRQLTIGGTYTAAAAATAANAAPANNILHNGYKLSHSLYIKAGIQKDDANPLWALTLNAGQSTESLLLKNNDNTANHFGVSAERHLGHGHTILTGGFNTNTETFTNSNLYGYLNHVYEQALTGGLSPAPASPNHGEHLRQQKGFLTIQQRSGKLNFHLASSIDAVDDKINQQLQRYQHETHFNTDAYATYDIRYSGNTLTSTVKLHALRTSDDVHITYTASGPGYHYVRTTDEGGLSFATTYSYNNTSTGVTIGDKFYRSTTATQAAFNLPEISAFLLQSNFLRPFSSAKLAATYSAFYSEPALDHSWAPYLLTRTLPQESTGFMPATEVQTFAGLSPVRRQELTSKLELTFWYWLTASADLSFRTSKGNPYPVYTNNELTLQNLADIRYKGLEFTLHQNSYRRRKSQLVVNNSISFWRYSNTVTHIAGGLDSLPIAGFSSIHNTLVTGQPLGVITGNAYTKNSIIGNPTPDFTLKLSHQLAWERFLLATDWQYRNGGAVWNIPKNYSQKGDNIRLNTLSLAYTIPFKHPRQQIRLLAYAENILVWSAYKGGDPQQRLFDFPDVSGLDYYNLPSAKSYGLNVSIQL